VFCPPLGAIGVVMRLVLMLCASVEKAKITVRDGGPTPPLTLPKPHHVNAVNLILVQGERWDSPFY